MADLYLVRHGQASFGAADYDKLSALGGARILVVEDNEINQEVAMGLLEDAGFVVELADDGAIAIRKVQEADAQHAFGRRSSGKPGRVHAVDEHQPRTLDPREQGRIESGVGAVS